MDEKRMLISVAIVVLALGLVSCSSSPELTDKVRAYEGAYNAHNLEEIAGLFTQNPTFELKGWFILEGKEAVKNIAAYDIALDIHISIGNIRTVNDTVYAHLTETNHWLEVAGIGETHYQVEFVFHDGAIQKVIGTPTPETEAAYQDVLGPLMEWARREAPDRLAELMPNGRFDYTAENAERALALLEDWKRSQEGE